MSPTQSPTALALPQADPLDADIAAYFAKCTEKLGLVPNVLRAYAFDQAKLRAFMALYNDLMLAPSDLTKAEREMIAVTVSALNRCHYCLTAHGAALRQLTGDPALAETIAQNWRAAPLDPRTRAMLAFTEKTTLASHTIEEPDREALRAAGFTDRDIWDIAAVAGFYAMSNRMASATAMAPNPEYHGMAR
ncbi:MAG: peroxidase-related enzyme [Gemmobacter sp.]